ncbi:Hydrophobic surface binding protein [Mycena sanguinolenta]|uniref:Hydrophobic surface binding protein n=1 Tax=Mycena sanguinolenta TaxID=230812 RepID=A0A8H6YHR1_9AGAR|nr:Hydrophobic surface binding protein [Mycena sanguinolenta]
MVQFTRSFFSLCLIAASFALPTKRTVAQVEADIASVSSQVTTLDNDIKGFPASGLLGALNIDTAANTLESRLNTATSDVKANGALDEADATTILNSVQAIEPVILDALSRLAADEPSAAALPIPGVPGLILSELQTLKTDADAFFAALIAAVPADLQAEATTIQTNIDAGFASAIAAYS